MTSHDYNKSTYIEYLQHDKSGLWLMTDILAITDPGQSFSIINYILGVGGSVVFFTPASG